MKPDHWGKPLRFGKLLARFYNLCAQRKASGILRFADKARLVVFPGRARNDLQEMEQHETKRIDSQPV